MMYLSKEGRNDDMLLFLMNLLNGILPREFEASILAV